MSVRREGEYEYSTYFSLNNYYGDAITGEFFETPSIDVVPILSEFSLNAPDPSGQRHLTTAPGFIQILGSGSNQINLDFGPLDFNLTNISAGSGISKTKCFIFRINEFDCNTTRVTHMKVWAPDLTDFLIPESFRIVYETHQQFPSGLTLPVNYLINKTKHLPTSLPELQNLRRQDNAYTIHGSGDADVSEYICMAVAASGTLPLGEYIGDPEGFVIRVTYNFDNISSMFD